MIVDSHNVVLKTDTDVDFYCRRVIITVPLGVLKKGQITFHPHLPQRKVDAICRSSVGGYKKIILEFPICFWPDDKAFIAQVPRSGSICVLFYNMMAMKRIPVLEAVLVGNALT